jgi:galactose-1-phosphate uridylyltransferase
MSRSAPQFIQKLGDGTIKQKNPFTNTEVWTVPERASRPLPNLLPLEPKLIEPKLREDYCSFCESLELETTPERARLVLDKGKYRLRPYRVPWGAKDEPAVFRRISNLFEIVSFDYWRQNYGHDLSPKRKKWKQAYLSDKKGVRHVKDILEYKLRCQGKSEEWIGRNVSIHWRELADGLFGGSNDLVIGKRHYVKDACFANELASCGELTADEHFQYIKFTLQGICDIHENNPYAVYTSVFQNWLSPAGASFDHLHKQIVGLDEWGLALDKMLKLASKDKQVFNEWFLNYSIDQGLFIAENASAVVTAYFGERFPTLAVFSKSKEVYPWKLSASELRDMSDLIHGCHAAMGAEIPCNEEWFFAPRNTDVRVPWHILIKWRINNPAGFEGNTEIFINTIDPWRLKERAVESMLRQRSEGKVAKFRIGEEAKPERNALRYCVEK